MELTIDGRAVPAEDGQTILDAALAAGVYIPHLCHHPDLPPFDQPRPLQACFRAGEAVPGNAGGEGYKGCGLCAVGIVGRDEAVLSCHTRVEEGMEIRVSDPGLEALRLERMSSILARHPHACLTCAQREGCSLTQCSSSVPVEERCCSRFQDCELRRLVEFIGVKEETPRYVFRNRPIEKDAPLFTRDYNLCVGCLRCVRVCESVVGAQALGFVEAGGDILVGAAGATWDEAGCRFCGACAEVCPTGAIQDKDLKAGNRRESLVPCTASCPLGMDVPSYVDFVARGRFDRAAEVIRRSVPLGLALGYVCAHPCTSVCRRGRLSQAIAICDLKRFALEAAEPPEAETAAAPTGKKVAVVGAGPAGLVAAHFLAKSGHSVTIFEAESEPGGMLRWAVPGYRLPVEAVRTPVKTIAALGVEIRTGISIDGGGAFRAEILDGSWDAVFVSVGARESRRIDFEGSHLEGVQWGLEFLREVKEGSRAGLKGRVVVIGGGNVALDVAMTCLRLGAASVELACLESEGEMPAFEWEIEEAVEEGAVIHTGWGLLRIVGKEGCVSAVELQRCLSVFDEKGTFRPEYDCGLTRALPADVVILAVGQRVEASFLREVPGVRMSATDTVEVDPETLETGARGIFAGGEAVLGPSSAVHCMAQGRRAASSINRYLGGPGLDPASTGFDQEPAAMKPWWGREPGFSSLKRVEVARLPQKDRLGSFSVIQKGYRSEEARREARRCLGCHLRFGLSRSTPPPGRWIEFTAEAIEGIPENGGAFQLFDENRETIVICGTPNLRQALRQNLLSRSDGRYFVFEENPMYTKKESEWIQRHLQKHGRLPGGNEEIDDLF